MRKVFLSAFFILCAFVAISQTSGWYLYPDEQLSQYLSIKVGRQRHTGGLGDQVIGIKIKNISNKALRVSLNLTANSACGTSKTIKVEHYLEAGKGYYGDGSGSFVSADANWIVFEKKDCDQGEKVNPDPNQPNWFRLQKISSYSINNLKVELVGNNASNDNQSNSKNSSTQKQTPTPLQQYQTQQQQTQQEYNDYKKNQDDTYNKIGQSVEKLGGSVENIISSIGSQKRKREELERRTQESVERIKEKEKQKEIQQKEYAKQVWENQLAIDESITNDAWNMRQKFQNIPQEIKALYFIGYKRIYTTNSLTITPILVYKLSDDTWPLFSSLEEKMKISYKSDQNNFSNIFGPFSSQEKMNEVLQKMKQLGLSYNIETIINQQTIYNTQTNKTNQTDFWNQ